MTIIQNLNANFALEILAEGLGLSAEEMQVYFVSLKLGVRPASKIADEAGLKRGHTYNLLESLKEKALIQEYSRNNVRQFYASSPEILIKLFEEKEEKIVQQKQKAKQLVESLKKVEHQSLIRPKISFFSGEDGIKTIYEDTLKVSNSIIYGIADFESVFPKNKNEPLHNWMWEYSTRRANKGIWYYGIVNKSKLSDLAFKRATKQKRKMKMINSPNLQVEVTIYQNKLAITSTANELIGFVIENAWIAKSLAGFHSAIWDMLPNYD